MGALLACAGLSGSLAVGLRIPILSEPTTVCFLRLLIAGKARLSATENH